MRTDAGRLFRLLADERSAGADVKLEQQVALITGSEPRTGTRDCTRSPGGRAIAMRGTIGAELERRVANLTSAGARRAIAAPGRRLTVESEVSRRGDAHDGATRAARRRRAQRRHLAGRPDRRDHRAAVDLLLDLKPPRAPSASSARSRT